MKNYKLAIVGATGVVGRTVLQVLQERNLPISKYVFFASKKSGGKTIHFMGEDFLVQELTESSFDEGFDYAIFSAGGSTSLKYAPIAVSKGCIVIDNSSAFRMEPNVPLVVPEVNPDVIKNHHGIIANPNCSTIQAMPVLKPLEDNYKIKRIIYSTYQAVSGAGQKGINDLENGIINYVHYNSLETPLEKFPHPIFNNCLPHIDVFLDNGYTKEEEKMINETRKILGRSDIKITATTVRVPVFNSHSESINVELENSFELSDIISLLKRSPNVVVQNDLIHNIYPLAANVSGNDEVFIGRIRRDFSIENGLNLWVVADNIRKGAATNAIQIVENLIELNH